VNLTGESKNFKILEFPLNKLLILSIDCFYFFRFELYNYDFLESNWEYPLTFFEKKSSVYTYLRAG
jgi:hypothetical protein